LELFGTGGTFVRLAAQGVRTVLVTATMGEEGEIVDPALDEQARKAMFPRLNKMKAFAAHKTQIAPDSFVFTLPAEQREQALGYEYFVLARRAITKHEGALEEDLLAGLA